MIGFPVSIRPQTDFIRHKKDFIAAAAVISSAFTRISLYLAQDQYFLPCNALSVAWTAASAFFGSEASI